MAIIIKDRVKETTVTQNTGTYTLAGTVTGFRTFLSAIGSTNQTYYVCEDGTNWETGLGTVGSGTLTRDTIYGSSNSNAAVNWGAGTRNIYCAYPAAGIAFTANNLSDLASATTARTNLGLGTAATLNVGTSANNILQLNGSAQIPAVDGSLVTGIVPFPSGTKMLFYQASAPTGWTKTTGINDKLLYITDGTGANPTGGTNNTGTGGWDNSWGLTVANHTLTVGEMPSHAHGPGAGNFILNSGTSGSVATTAGSNVSPSLNTDTVGGGLGHNHGISSTSQWRPPALYVIVASKN